MTNWPWPMEGVQKWFEGLWDWISEAAIAAVAPVSEWIRERVAWLKDQLDLSFAWVGGLIGGLLEDVKAALGKGWEAITSAVTDAVGEILAGARELVDGVGLSIEKMWSSFSSAMSEGFRSASTHLSQTAAWLGGELSDGISGLTSTVRDFVTDAVAGGMDWVRSAIAGVAGALGDGLKAFMAWVQESLEDMARGISTAMAGVRGAVEPIFTGVASGIMGALTRAVKQGSPPEEIGGAVQEFAEAYMARMRELSTFETSSVPKLEELLPKAAGIIAANMGAAVVAEVAGSALDLAHPMKDIGFRMIAMDLVESVQMPAMVGPLMMGPVWPGVIVPLRYRFNELSPTSIPLPGQLVEIASRGALAVDEYTQAMKFHALDESWSARMLVAAYRTPGFPDLQLMAWRGVLDAGAVEEALRRQGVRPEYLEAYTKILERIPGPGDLVRFAVREAFTREELDVEFPEGFATWMLKQGYADIWARYFWRAHWVLVPLGQLYGMRHRGLISEAQLSEQLKFHDYAPEWRPRLIELSWNLPGRIDARWMFRWGQISVEEMRDLLVAGGLHPGWADRVAVATAKNQWLTEINRLRDNSKRRFIRGYDSEEQLRANLAGLGYPPNWVEFHVRDAVEDSELALLDDMVDALEDGYLKDLVTEDELEARLSSIIVRPQVVQRELERLYIQKYKKAKEPTPEKISVLPVSTLRTAYREDIIGAALLEEELLARGYTLEDVELIIALEDARR